MAGHSSHRTRWCACILVAACGIPTLAAEPPKEDPFFPYGAMHMCTIPHWQHYLPDMEEYARYLDGDFARMRAVRFNSVAVHIDWCDIETAPGQFRFERLDTLVELAEKHGLRLLLWPWPELQPEWVPQAYPDSEMIASDGYRPAMACWDHPTVRQMVAAFVHRVVSRYKDRPSVLAWDVGAEAGNWVSSINNPIDQARTARLYCYCDHTVKRYREWLRRKYRTLGRLNETWATYYGDWSEIRPIRTGIFERAQVHWVDWREFMLQNVAEAQGLKADAARRADPHHPITCHMGGWGGAYVYGSTDEYAIGKHFDVVSLSLFPYWIQYGHGFYEPAFAGLVLDGVRSAGDGKPMWVEELQGGPSINGLLYRSQFPRPQDIRLWVWQSIAHGASGIFYWNWRPETTGIEAGGFGLVHYDGTLTDRARAAGEVCEQLQRLAGLLRSARPVPAEVAIFHSPRTSIHAYGDGDEAMYIRSVRGVYRAMWRAGLPVDFLVTGQLLSRDLSRYKVLYVPFGYTLSKTEGARLRTYVENGGTLFADMWCGFKDDRTFVYETVPGAGMAEVLRCKEVQTNPRPNGKLRITKAYPAVAGLPAGTEVPTIKWQQQLDVSNGAEVVAEFEDGNPAILISAFGKGRTIYAGTPVCRYFDESLNANALRLIQGAAAGAGARPPVAMECEPATATVEARVLAASGGKRVVIVLNHGETSAKVHARIAVGPGAKVSDLLSGAAVALQPGEKEGEARFSLELKPVEARVLLIE